MKIKCIIVDDDPLAIAVLQNYIRKVPVIEIIKTSNNAIDVYKILKDYQVDLIFLDIEMPGLSGLDLLKTLDSYPAVILTSANKEYALDGFDLNVLDFLLKPISNERFLKAIQRVLKKEKTIQAPEHQDTSELFNEQNGDYIFVRENKKMIKIPLKEILAIESIKDYVKIITKDRTVIIKQQLSFFEEKLTEKDFIRIHRSIIVPIGKIDGFSSTAVSINKRELPIGRTYKNAVLNALKLQL